MAGVKTALARVLGSVFFVVVVLGPAAPALSADSGWRPPVAGELLRGYAPGAHAYAAGAHRGIDLAARPGDPVLSACTGEVAFAGVVAGRPVVTIACGEWRVTHLPVIRPRIFEGQRVKRSQLLGLLGVDDSHSGLHLGVRRAGLRSGYVDPWPLLSGRHGGPQVLPGARPRHARRTRGRPPHTIAARPVRPAPGISPETALAPPLAWLGLGVLLAGCLGARGSSRRSRGLARVRRTAHLMAFTRHVRSRTGEPFRRL